MLGSGPQSLTRVIIYRRVNTDYSLVVQFELKGRRRTVKDEGYSLGENASINFFLTCLSSVATKF